MNAEQLSFFNLQLAGMIKSGLPLEGALKELASGLQRGRLRAPLDQLNADLSQGKPLDQALDRTSLPPFYCQMIKLGARSGHLASMLTLMADYYQRLHHLGTRLKGMLVYPAILLVVTLLVSIGLRLANQILAGLFSDAFYEEVSITKQLAMVGMAPWVLGGFMGLVIVAWLVPMCRSWLRWRLPGFKETQLVKLASSLSILLRGGLALQESVQFLGQLEQDTLLRRELQRWRERMESGQGKFQDMVSRKHIVPPLFVWLVAQGGDDLGAGFDRAAALYQSRADYRFELFLYAVLPVSILALGLMILGQMVALASILNNFYNSLMAPW